MTATPDELFAAKQEAARDMMAIIKRRRPLNAMEGRLLDALYSEIGAKYLLLTPVDGFKVEARAHDEQAELLKGWF